MFKKFRIVTIGDKFIPQQRDGFQWKGLTTNGDTWFGIDYQKKYCGVDTQTEAEDIIEGLTVKVIKYV